MADVKELRELLDLVLALGNAAGKSLEDGKLGLSDAAHLVPALSAAIPALSGLSKIGEEVKDLDDAEKEALVAHVKEKFDIPQDNVESIVEGGLSVALSLAKLVALMISKPEPSSSEPSA